MSDVGIAHIEDVLARCNDGDDGAVRESIGAQYFRS